MINCNMCQAENEDNAKYCKKCGNKFENSLSEDINVIVCTKCDHLNSIDTKFCEKCGEKIVINKDTKLKSRLISIILEDHEWTEEAVAKIREGLNKGMMKTEAKEIYLEAKERKIKLLKILEESKKEITEKDTVEIINERIKENKNELLIIEEEIGKNQDNSFVCPYCKREINVEGGVKEEELRIKCNLCGREFLCITGITQVIRGKTNAAVQYGAEPISITLKLENRILTINFNTNFRFLLTKRDKISIIYLKKWFSNSFKENPSFIYNWSSEDFYKVGLSLF